MPDDHPVYLDCNATTPLESEVADFLDLTFRTCYGNAGSRTHAFGSSAATLVKNARVQIGRIVDAAPEEVVFTSGSTESNNLAILGSIARAEKSGRRHIVTSAIEHKAVLEPIELLRQRGFEVTCVPPDSSGVVRADAVLDAVRTNTFLISLMHVNNETGVMQPVAEVADRLRNDSVIFHTDAAQGFGKDFDALRHPRIDLISISGHKVFAPKGIGALVVRLRDRTVGLTPLTLGGGQERGLRPGTLAVPLIGALGLAAEIAARDAQKRDRVVRAFRREMMAELQPLGPQIHGHPDLTLPHVVNWSFGEIDAEALMISLKDLVAVATGSACTSSRYEASHVLRAMGMSEAATETATRWSWCHLTPKPDWSRVRNAIEMLR
jgi:cysteine desulfurase